VRELMRPLSKGPWSAHGSVVYGGSKVLAACPGAVGEQTAKALADTLNAVDLMLAMTPAMLMDELERSLAREGELLEENRQLIAELRSSFGHLQETDGQGTSA
jgi:hypothetical protein